jgi:hypothetical protein
VRLKGSTTSYYDVRYSTPKGSPLSPILYILYLAELLTADTLLRFGYADDIYLYRVSYSFNTNIKLLAYNVRSIL